MKNPEDDFFVRYQRFIQQKADQEEIVKNNNFTGTTTGTCPRCGQSPCNWPPRCNY